MDDRFDQLIASSLKKSGASEMHVSEDFYRRLMYETRPYARFRNHPRRWALVAVIALVSCASVAAVTGILPMPFFAAAPKAAKPVRTVAVAAPVVAPVNAAKGPTVVRPKHEQVSDEIDRSIANALKYLASQQRDDGAFPGQYGESTAIPALVGMAFLSRGHLVDDKEHGETVSKCLDYVLSKADMRDNFPFKGYLGGAGGGRMYAHSIATLFLSECSGMVDAERQKRLDEILPFAVKVILDAQNQRKDGNHMGGWRYEPNSNDSDLSCSGWALMALKSARLNGAQVPDEAIEKAVMYIKRAHREGDGTFGYQGANGGNADTLSGAAILCLELCGRHLEPESIRASKYLEQVYQRSLATNAGGHRYYGLYYTAQGLFQIGGEVWKGFESWMYENYLKSQQPDGSWHGGGNEGNPVYATAMTVLAFTVPYRMLPIYQRDETVDY